MLELNTLQHMSCFDAFAEMPDHSVRSIITDLPYFKTEFKWDKARNFDIGKFIDESLRVVAEDGVLVTTCDIRLLFKMQNARPKDFRYEWIWSKAQPTGHMNARAQRMISHEFVAVFSKACTTSNKNAVRAVYNPQGLSVYNKIEDGRRYVQTATHSNKNLKAAHHQLMQNFPRSVIQFPVETKYDERINPTQKPLALMRYLVQTYSDPGDIIYEPCAGAATTCLAAMLTGRDFYATELGEKQWRAACKRLAAIQIDPDEVAARVQRERDYLALPALLAGSVPNQLSLF